MEYGDLKTQKQLIKEINEKSRQLKKLITTLYHVNSPVPRIPKTKNDQKH